MLALTVVLGGLGTLSLVIEPVGWLLTQPWNLGRFRSVMVA